jgi:hypothetical protein
MKTPLTVNRLRELLDYDPTTGVFTRRVTTSSRAQAGEQVGSPTARGYLRVQLDGQMHYLHRLAWLYVNGAWPANGLDHIDGNVANNRVANLRDVDHPTNMQNLRRARADNKTGLLGVWRRNDTGRYSASLKAADGTKVSLGCFDSAQQAHEVYLTAKRKHHEGCTL